MCSLSAPAPVCGMTFAHVEPWWKRKDHRGIRGARGARFASLSFHAVFILSTVALIEFIFRSTDEMPYHIAPPPVPAPPPLERSVSTTLANEMPHLRRLEVEKERPPHLPHVDSLNYKKLREEGKIG